MFRIITKYEVTNVSVCAIKRVVVYVKHIILGLS